MKQSLRNIETRQLEEALFSDINILNAIQAGVDPITCVMLKIPPTVTIDKFYECFKNADGDRYRCFTFFIDSYYKGIKLSDPCYPAMKRISSTIGAYSKNLTLPFDGHDSMSQSTDSASKNRSH
jgi:hypothetical protein